MLDQEDCQVFEASLWLYTVSASVNCTAFDHSACPKHCKEACATSCTGVYQVWFLGGDFVGESLSSLSSLKLHLKNHYCLQLAIIQNCSEGMPLAVLQLDNGWSEDTVTWNSKPPLSKLQRKSQVAEAPVSVTKTELSLWKNQDFILGTAVAVSNAPVIFQVWNQFRVCACVCRRGGVGSGGGQPFLPSFSLTDYNTSFSALGSSIRTSHFFSIRRGMTFCH